MSTQSFSSGLPSDEWTHIVFTIGDNKATLYQNGVLVDYIDGVSYIHFDNPTLGSAYNGVEFFAGKLTEHGFFDKVLSEEEIGMFRGDEMSRGDRIKTARNAKRVWDQHIQHRIPSGHLVSNEPDENPDDNRRNPEKNTRASIYQKSGFGKTNRMGKQYSTKIGKKLHPVNDDED